MTFFDDDTHVILLWDYATSSILVSVSCLVSYWILYFARDGRIVIACRPARIDQESPEVMEDWRVADVEIKKRKDRPTQVAQKHTWWNDPSQLRWTGHVWPRSAWPPIFSSIGLVGVHLHSIDDQQLVYIKNERGYRDSGSTQYYRKAHKLNVSDRCDSCLIKCLSRPAKNNVRFDSNSRIWSDWLRLGREDLCISRFFYLKIFYHN